MVGLRGVHFGVVVDQIEVVGLIVGVDITKLYTCLEFKAFGKGPGIIGFGGVDIDVAGQVTGEDGLALFAHIRIIGDVVKILIAGGGVFDIVQVDG